MKVYKKPKKCVLKDGISHQNIGGKIILLERETTLDYFLDKDFKNMTIAEMNFIKRRMDLFLNFSDEECSKIKCYYGHVENLGYWVCEDEIKGEV